MSLDMNVLQAKLTGPMSFAKKAAHIAETYIRAYYLPESESLAFIKQHLSVFTKQQLLRLIEVSPWPRKAKLLAEDLIVSSENVHYLAFGTMLVTNDSILLCVIVRVLVLRLNLVSSQLC